MVDVNWGVAICFNGLLLIACSFGYSWSAFKSDLKTVCGLDESVLAMIFTACNFGQNFVVHMGLLYDKFGPRVAGFVALLFKLCGLLGMHVLLLHNMHNAALVGFLLFLDAQASGMSIIIAQVEGQKVVSNPRMRGVTASICTAAFGLGAVAWTSAYDIIFRPDIPSHFLYGGLVSGVFIALGMILHPIFARNVPASVAMTTEAADKKPETTVWEIIRGADFIACMLSTCVTWGTAVLWLANMSNFGTAAGLTNGREVRFAFNFMGFLGRSVCGPITDMLSMLPLEFFSFLMATMCLSAVVMMLVSDGQLILSAAVISGFGFGCISTIVPLLCRRMAPHASGTIYAISKVGSMIVSNIWVFYSGKWAHEAKGSANECTGVACYRYTWIMVISTCVPIMTYLFSNLLRVMRLSQQARKKDLALRALKKSDVKPGKAASDTQDNRKKGRSSTPTAGKTVSREDSRTASKAMPEQE